MASFELSSLDHDNGSTAAIVWTAALTAALALHLGALFGMTTTPPKPKSEPITMAIAIPEPPEPAPEPPEPPEPPKKKPEKPPEKQPEPLPLPPAPPTPAPPPPDAQPPAASTEKVTLEPQTGDGVAVAVGAVDGTGTQPVSGERTTEPATNRGQAGPAQPEWDENGYKSDAWALMNKAKRYPRKAQVMGLVGKCVVSVKLNHDGSLASPPKLLGKGTGHDVLDAECTAMAERTRFAPIPSHVPAPVTFRFPIEFVLENP